MPHTLTAFNAITLETFPIPPRGDEDANGARYQRPHLQMLCAGDRTCDYTPSTLGEISASIELICVLEYSKRQTAPKCLQATNLRVLTHSRFGASITVQPQRSPHLWYLARDLRCALLAAQLIIRP